ncbi:MAG: hypothetical protein C3F06_00015 [Candidatus Methanoperedenaceae archaeon]|nr:MAG: hypothetical protein C3F06_00015 [Candidatus Methanoperedenaceae archaeon]
MKLLKVVLIISMVLLFTGCIENIADRFEKIDVVYVNLTVLTEGNETLITVNRASMGEVNKLNAPGFVVPDKFPGIYIKLKQAINASKPLLVNDISVPNGINYIGSGNYSFTIQLYKNTLNESMPVYIYSEIIDNRSMRLGRSITSVNLTK